MEKFLDDPTSSVFYLPFASHKRHLEIFHDILGPGWKLVYLIDSFSLANREFLGRSATTMVTCNYHGVNFHVYFLV